MRTFTDKTGRVWDVVVDDEAIMRVRNSTGYLLGHLPEDASLLAGDALLDVLAAFLQPQADGYGVSPQQLKAIFDPQTALNFARVIVMAVIERRLHSQIGQLATVPATAKQSLIIGCGKPLGLNR